MALAKGLSAATEPGALALWKVSAGLKPSTNKLWEDLFSNPSNWWDNRFDKAATSHPDFRHKIFGEPLWLNSQFKPKWVDANLASLNAQNADTVNRFHWACKLGQLDMALHLLLQIPDHATENMYYSLLKACNERKDLSMAKSVQSCLARNRLDAVGFLGEYLVITLSKCGAIEDALDVFKRLSKKSVYCWTALISGYVEIGKLKDALDIYISMLQDDFTPNDYTFAALLKICACFETGKWLHAEAKKYNYASDVFVGTNLIEMYARCRNVALAQEVFDQLSERNVVSWTAMMSAYVEDGNAKRSLQLYDEMIENGVSPDDRAFVIALQACSSLMDYECVLPTEQSNHVILRRGQELHTEASVRNYESDVFVGNSLVSLYGKCKKIVEAETIFYRLPYRDSVSWNAMLWAFIDNRLPYKAFRIFRQMKDKSMLLDDRTYVAVLQACSILMEEQELSDSAGNITETIAMEIGKAIHSECRFTKYDSNLFVAHTLMNLYANCGHIREAELVFGSIKEHSAVSWTVLLSAYLKQGEDVKTLQLFKKMQDEGFVPTARTFAIVLQACSVHAEKESTTTEHHKSISLLLTKALHADAKKNNFHLDMFITSSLIDIYMKYRELEEANNILSTVPHDHVAVWSALLYAYIEQDKAQDVLDLYEKMQKKCVQLTDIILLYILQACSKTRGVDICYEVHFKLVCANFDMETLLANTMIHTYGTCACISDAQAIFETLPVRDVASWNTLIGSYAQQGDWSACLHLFEKMERTHVKPDSITFTFVLSACCQIRLVEKGFKYLESMSKNYMLNPEIAHYSIVLDLLGRAGDFHRVHDLLSSMPMEPDISMWLCLLGACQMHGNTQLGRYAYQEAVRLQPQEGTAYVMMSNMYINSGIKTSQTLDSQMYKS